jgi:acyl-CoA synthetase (AMP-forming)/AMP-acid ligase II
MLVLGDIVRLNAKRYPDKSALIFPEETFTHAELNKRANRIAHALLSMGLKPGDRVGIWSRNCPEYIPILFAVWKCGAVIVPINFRFKVDELLLVLGNAEPKILLHAGEFGAMVEEAARKCTFPMQHLALS